MSCPICNYGMMSLVTGRTDRSMWWCPRCGTIKTRWNPSGEEECGTPILVELCRQLQDFGIEAASFSVWHRLGIDEAINLPGERPC